MKRILVVLGVLCLLFVGGCATFNQTTEWRVSNDVTIGGGAILKF